ncbi:MAG TPA: Nif3-like dinuclear metal center hexameric protein [Acidobacteriota bacterium]|jgi:dinuclear metal center YbgI/SA1388 family protein|nr:Nif3-like dinuclear metal center hexameric protein [Acidobacteriota bacterium]
MNRSELIQFLDTFLDINSIPDKSLNGWQIEGAKEIERVSFAVDFCEASAGAARKDRSQMLVVHHGFFWGEPQAITGHRFRQLETLLGGNVNLYAAHLPLDAHPEVGNNAQLARLLELGETAPFGLLHGHAIGLIGQLPEPVKPEVVARRLDRQLDTKTELLKFGPKQVSRVAVVSGDAAMLVEQAADSRADAFVTGEVSHTAYHIARERAIHLLCAGHYATETVGLKALARKLENIFGLETRWIDLPTGF